MKITKYKWDDKIFNVHPPKKYLYRHTVGLYWARVLHRLESNNWNVKDAMLEVANDFGYTYSNLMYQKFVYVRIIKRWMHSYNTIQKTIANKKSLDI